ncbi:MAG TPA: glycosyltransferase family 4 protein [Chthoniobacterales bacterium]|nr:glycosyltransferase family 4 protein [Chthoniobacterales bacterium]
MKIAMYVPSWPPDNSANGIVSYAGHVIPALRELGHEVFVLARHSEDTKDLRISQIGAFREAMPFWNRALFRLAPTSAMYHADAAPLARAVKALVTRHEIDILEMEESYGLSYAITKLALVPVVVRLHGPWFLTKSFEDARREALERRGIITAAGVTAPSNQILRSVERQYRLKLRKSLTFGNPVSVPSCKWRVSNCNVNSLLFIGRFDELKGGDLVINAFGRLAENNPKLTLTFVGPDYGIDGMKLWDYARTRLSPDALSRLDYRGRLSSVEVEKLRPLHFVTICASRFEVFPYTVLEALAVGCPLVTSDVGGIPEIVRSGQSGILFESGNIDDLVSSVQSLLDNPDFAGGLGRRGRRSLRRYRPEAIAALVTDFYEQSIQSFKARHRTPSLKM